ncbi:hypothetical protein [Rhizobium leguminosarum]|uniref:hypothetical protein n=1 Tax=Rhizobium leguminosarum TaxID=384 RepID=UPI001C94E742|nr:hypothetical protein [Rhizobium leguminosarum]MBY5727778.1 hypothetical protein [Rhizobium leguminosarum]
MPYAEGLDHIGTDTPLCDPETGQPWPGVNIEITFEQYADAINLLVNGCHVCVVDRQFVLDYQLPPQGP